MKREHYKNIEGKIVLLHCDRIKGLSRCSPDCKFCTFAIVNSVAKRTFPEQMTCSPLGNSELKYKYKGDMQCLGFGS